jgi:hypothetical protein
MAWLGDVEGGGGTAFIHESTERLLMPKRGSLGFWYNLDMKGHRDRRLSHGGCPVLKGSKWIFNKWINSFDQFQKFPCGLQTDGFFPAPTGHYKNIERSDL